MTKNKADSVGIMFRFITPIVMSLVFFIVSQISTDVREIRKDVTALRNDVVYKEDYKEEKKIIHSYLRKLDDICTSLKYHKYEGEEE